MDIIKPEDSDSVNVKVLGADMFRFDVGKG